MASQLPSTDNANFCLRKLAEVLVGLQPTRRSGQATTYDIALPLSLDRGQEQSDINRTFPSGREITTSACTKTARTLGSILGQITNPSPEFSSLKTIVNKMKPGERRVTEETTSLWGSPIQSKTTVNQRRIKYTGQANDSLRNIAKRKLGDERYERLLLTINRAEVLHISIEGEMEHIVKAGQIIWLPTEEELEVHRRHFFPKSSTKARDSVKTEVRTPSTSTIESPKIERIGQKSGPPSGPDSSPLAPILYRVRYLGNRDSVNLKEIGKCHQISFLHKISAIAHVSEAPTSLRINSGAISAEQALELEAMMSVKKLSPSCRLLCADRNGAVFSIKLQTEINNRWRTIASYECLHGKTLRRTHKINGSSNVLEVGLPTEVARQMSKEDFRRNWRFYYERFMSSEPSLVHHA